MREGQRRHYPRGQEEALREGLSAGVTGGGKRWRDRKGGRRGYWNLRAQARPEEESAGVTGGESASVTGEGKPEELREPGEGCCTYYLVSLRGTVAAGNGLGVSVITVCGEARDWG